jgi:hypothetical protein
VVLMTGPMQIKVYYGKYFKCQLSILSERATLVTGFPPMVVIPIPTNPTKFVHPQRFVTLNTVT